MKIIFAGLHTVVMSFPGVSLLLHISLLGQASAKLKCCALESHDSLLTLAKAHFSFIDPVFVYDPLLFHLINMRFLFLGHLPFQALDVRFQLAYLSKQTRLILCLHNCVLFNLLSNFHDLSLKLFAGIFAISDKLLILCHIFL